MARNWRCREGELDVVARRGRLHVFCEVKARSTGVFGSPAEAVGAGQAGPAPAPGGPVVRRERRPSPVAAGAAPSASMSPASWPGRSR